MSMSSDQQSAAVERVMKQSKKQSIDVEQFMKQSKRIMKQADQILKQTNQLKCDIINIFGFVMESDRFKSLSSRRTKKNHRLAKRHKDTYAMDK